MTEEPQCVCVVRQAGGEGDGAIRLSKELNFHL